MWIKSKYFKTKSKIVYWFCQRYANTKEKRFVILGHFMCIETPLFSILDISKACMRYIDIDFININKAIYCLRVANDALLYNTKIDVTLFNTTRNSVSIERVFMDDKMRYVNTVEAVETFKSLSINFVNLYSKIESEKIGIPGYNNRCLNRFQKSIIELADQLRDYSYE